MDEMIFDQSLIVVGLGLILFSTLLLYKALKYEHSLDVKLFSREALLILGILIGVMGFASIAYSLGFHVDKAPFGSKYIIR